LLCSAEARLAELGMHRALITKAQYLAELNRRLRSHPLYEVGMVFVPSGNSDPEAAEAIDWTPGGSAPPSLFAKVAAEVHALFRVA